MLEFEVKMRDAIDPGVLVEYLRRSYFVVDGLWFVKTEEAHSFEHALDLDEQVWKVLAKIQARKARDLLGVEGTSLTDFLRVLTVKLEAEQYGYEVEECGPDRLRLRVDGCPWYDLLEKSGRGHLGPQIADHICRTELEIWGETFDPEIRFELKDQQCRGDAGCVWEWRMAYGVWRRA